MIDPRAHARHAASWTPKRTVLRRRVLQRRRCDVSRGGGDAVSDRRRYDSVVVNAVRVDDLAVLQLDALHLAVQSGDLCRHVVAVRLSAGQRPRLNHASRRQRRADGNTSNVDAGRRTLAEEQRRGCAGAVYEILESRHTFVSLSPRQILF